MPTSPTPNPDPKKPEGKESKPPADKPIEAGTPSAKFLQELVGGTPKPAAKPKVDADDHDDKSDKGADGEQKPAPKPAAKKKAAAPPAPIAAIDENKLGEAIGKSIAKHSAEAPKAEKKEQASPADEKEARKIAVLERMEKLNGNLYTGIVERYKQSKAELKKYAAEWEKANPGEKFDPEAEEHEAVIQELEDKFDYDDEDYNRALARIEIEDELKSRQSPREAELEERLTEVERVEKARSKGAEIVQVAYAAGNDCWKELGDDFAGVVKEDGAIDGEVLAEIKKSDPIKHDIAVAAATAAEVGAMKIHMLANGLERYEAKNPQHAAVSRFAHEQEQRMLGRAPADRTDDEGRAFATKEQYAAMTPEQQARHWVFSPDDLKALWVHDVARRAKADLAAEDDKFTRRAKARGLIADDEKTEVRTDKPARRRVQADDEVEDDELSDNGKPKSPSFSVSPKTAVGKPGGGSGAKSGLERFVDPLLA